MIESWLVRGAVGGALIGLSASLLLIQGGRVAGISGILNGLMRPTERSENGWRALFVVGLVVGGALTLRAVGHTATTPSLVTALIAGVLVGAGTRLGSGCTSGHGVCGLSRLSLRSLAATLTFIATGALTVLATGGAGGAP